MSFNNCEAGLTQYAQGHRDTQWDFHCDEALAVYMLRLTETYRNAGYPFHTERYWYMAFHKAV